MVVNCLMNELTFSKEDILLNAYNISKEICKTYVEELSMVKGNYLYGEYFDLLEEQLEITRELKEFIIRNKYALYSEVEDVIIDKKIANMTRKLESISK